MTSLDVKSFRLLDGKSQLLVEFVVGFIRWKVNAVKTGERERERVIITGVNDSKRNIPHNGTIQTVHAQYTA